MKEKGCGAPLTIQSIRDKVTPVELVSRAPVIAPSWHSHTQIALRSYALYGELDVTVPVAKEKVSVSSPARETRTETE
jgi:hypothetical protein